ncbi:antiviral reverse transcriptase Drt4 [Rhodoferax sp.]|uniref:antiviral reverse transcriptase Drt4 n=1 Tax=Rhodoferax sp. TaxID=50421 RepID=UPI0025ECAD06|nr:antiviral reverse transcriptase Drt4 [Rhodoferax sp.]
MKEFAVSHVANDVVFATRRHFLEALTRWNYFPNQKSSASELPPNICTKGFTPEVAFKLSEIQLNKERRKGGFDLVEYRATRYNNVSRVLGLIHPLAFANVFAAFDANYAELEAARADENSAIHVEQHSDGRMLIMNYEDFETKAARAVQQSFGKRFRAHTDVANCFGSIYTHSLEWAIQGFEVAKASLVSSNQPTHWSSNLDRVLRMSKRNETSGLPIGPATSSIAVEVILAAVDRELRKRNFSFERYIDDYAALCATYEEAQDFTRTLGKELSKYRLTLNLAKTHIAELPEPAQEKWVAELMSAATPLLREDGQISYLNSGDAFQFLDHAIRLNNETPDGSVIKFAVAIVAGRVKDNAAANVFEFVLNLAWHYPILLPYLEKIDARADSYDKEKLVEKLNSIISVNVDHRRSDGICWALYYLERLEAAPSDSSIARVIESEDCVAIAMLSNFEVAVDRINAYAKSILNSNLYAKDQNWLLLYQLYRRGLIADPYENEKTFEVLKQYEVDFFCVEGASTLAEKYCDYVSNPFIEDTDRQNFDEWLQAAEK